MSEVLQLALDSEGVIRLRAVGATSLDLTLDSVSASGPTLALKLSGESMGLPNGTRCVVTCLHEGAESRPTSHAATLSVPGWRPGEKQRCTLDLTLPIVAARLFGAGSFRLEVLPQVPHAKPAAVKGSAAAAVPVEFDHPIDVQATAGGKLLIGQEIVITPKVAAVFAGCLVRVSISEHDGKKPGKDSFALQQDWGGSVPLDEPRSWRVGCDAGGHLDYAEPDEADETYEFHRRVLVSSDAGKTWVEALGPAELCTAARPKLTTFELEVASDTSSLALELWERTSEVSLTALARKLHGDAPLGHSRVYARGRIEPLAPDLAVEVGVTLWMHRPAEVEPLRVAAPLPYRATATLRSGDFKVLLVDGAALGETEVLGLSSPTVLFAVLELSSWTKKKLPLAAVLSYDPEVFLPFGEGPLPVSVCTRGVSDLLSYSPVFGPVVVKVEGDALVVSARLLVSAPDYWKEAGPRLEYQVDGTPTWDDLKATVTKDGSRVEWRKSAADWAGNGKQVNLRARASKPSTRLAGALVLPPAEMTTRYLCKPAVTSVVAKHTAEGGVAAITIRAATRYVSTGTTTKALSIQLVVPDGTATKPLPATVTYARPCGPDGLCDADGNLLATVVVDAAVQARIARGEVSVRVYRKSKLFGQPVAEYEVKVPPA